jgi:hypothetical protein
MCPSSLNPPYLETPDETRELIKGPTAGMIDGDKDKEYARELVRFDVVRVIEVNLDR